MSVSDNNKPAFGAFRREGLFRVGCSANIGKPVTSVKEDKILGAVAGLMSK